MYRDFQGEIWMPVVKLGEAIPVVLSRNYRLRAKLIEMLMVSRRFDGSVHAEVFPLSLGPGNIV